MKRCLIGMFVSLAAACTRSPRDSDAGAKDASRAQHPSDAIAIAAGSISCVLRRDGSVWCWGAGIPLRVADVAGAVEISVGGSVGCARTKSGAVPCFSLKKKEEDRPFDGPLSGLVRDARSISNSNDVACAVTNDGLVDCWRLHPAFPTSEGGDYDPPVLAFAKGVRAKLVRVGARHACVLGSMGTIVCWGANDGGQLGVGHANPVDGPVVVPGLSTVVDLIVGDNHTCALDANGFVSCWGAGKLGQLGDGMVVGRSSPTRVPGLKDIVQLFAGPNTTCAKERSGKILCFGDGSQGLLIDPTISMSPAPRELPLDDMAAIAIGRSHACSLARDARVRCWGLDALLGSGRRSDARPLPFRIPELSHVEEIVAGNDHTVARLSDDTLVGAGNATELALGELAPPLGDRVRFTPVFSSLRRPTSVNAGRGWTCVVDETGPWCSGVLAAHRSGVLPYTAPPARLAELPAVTRIVGHDNVRCALTTDGAVYCWGEGYWGQLGDGTKRSRATPEPVPGLRGVRDLDVNRYHACAVLADESLRCWGSSSSAGLGDTYFGPAGRPTKIRSVPRAKAVATGLRHTCVLVSDGSVVCFGANDEGQLGDGSRKGRTSPAPVPGIQDAVGISAGEEGGTTCAVLRDGHVVCWGTSNYFGESGVGDYEPRLAPTIVRDINNATSVSVGAFHTCARLADGGAACWGNNHESQLGDGYERWTAVPRDVIFERSPAP